MASTILSSASYLKYLNDYVTIIYNYTDQGLIEHLHEPYFDEIETHARSILVQWHGEQVIDKQTSLYIENVGYLNRKIALLTQTCRLNQTQLERIESLLCNSAIIAVVTSIIESILKTDRQHQDSFLGYLSIFIDAFSLMNSSKSILHQITQQAIESKYYKQYLTEAISSDIHVAHRFFIGALGQLALSTHDSTLHELYSQLITKFYTGKYLPDNIDLHYCTLGVLSQLDVSFLINDYSCISALRSILIKISPKKAEDKLSIFLLPLLHLFNSLCIQSRTVACYLNTDQFIDTLLHYVTNQTHSRIHIYACLLLGHIVSEKQLIELRISYKLTTKLMDLLAYCKTETKSILDSLLSLAIHEQIQFLMAQMYQLRHLIQLSEHYPIIYDILWKLSFHSDVVDQLIEQHEEFLKQLSSLSTLPGAMGILQNIQMKNSARLLLSNQIIFDFNLVASAKDREIVQPIENNLLKSNLHAGTILNSQCILLCLSEESKHDCACQAAVQQALLECKKIILCIIRKPCRIDDWFSTLNIQERRPLDATEASVEKISSEVQKSCRNIHHLPAITKRTRIVTPSHRDAQTTFTLSPPPLSLLSETSPRMPANKIQNWTNREVLAWCDNNKLNAFSKILTLYDGRNLLALAHVSRMSAPHAIINQLRNDCRKQGLRVSFVEFVRFQAALAELLHTDRSMTRKQSISTLATRYVYKKRLTHPT